MICDTILPTRARQAGWQFGGYCPVRAFDQSEYSQNPQTAARYIKVNRQEPSRPNYLLTGGIATLAAHA
jgi:hypothetical protein